jgi:hypothetical protein
VHVRSTFSTLATALVLTACGDVLGNGEDALYRCRDQETKLDDDAGPAPLLGFGPSAVLDWAAGPREDRARFLPSPANVSSNVPEGEAGISFAITRDEGDAVQVQRDPSCGGSTELRIPTRLTLTTEGGALDESVPSTLVADRLERARLEAPLTLDELDGSWELTLDASLRVVSSGVFIVLTPEGSAGHVGVMLEQRTADAVTLFAGSPLMRWPAGDACQPLEVPRALADDDAEWVAPMADVRVSEWSTAAGASPARSATVTIEAQGVDCEPASGDRYAPFVVRVRMSDDGGEVQLPASVRRTADGLELELALGFHATDGPDAFITRFGDFGLELGRFEMVTLELSLAVGASGAATGVFAVVGLDASCKSVCDARGCTGCPPYEQHRLLELGMQAP